MREFGMQAVMIVGVATATALAIVGLAGDPLAGHGDDVVA